MATTVGPRRITEEDDQRIMNLYLVHGMSVRQIEARLGIKRTTIQSRLSILGVQCRHATRPRQPANTLFRWSFWQECSKCHRVKAIGFFARDPRITDGLAAVCSMCKNEITRNSYYKSVYGITLEEYDILLEEQNGKCKICGSDDNNGQRFCVDHCHETGKVRGLLCRPCNLALGCLRDDPILVLKAADYLVGVL